MFTPSHLTIIALVSTLSLFIGCSQPEDNTTTDENAASTTSVETDKNLKAVKVIELAPTSFKSYVSVQATVEADQNVSVTTDMGGLIDNILVTEGQKVNKGDVLVAIDSRLAKNALKDLETSYDLAVFLFEKQQKLWDQNIGSELQYKQAKNQKESLENKIEAAKIQLDKLQIKAPVSGRVDDIFVKSGELLAPGMPTVRVVNTNKLKLEADVPERYIQNIRKGDNVQISLPIINKKAQGRIASVGQFIHADNRTFKVFVPITNKNNSIKPNMLAELELVNKSYTNQLVIPTRLIQQRGETQYVLVVEKLDGQHMVAKKVITMGETYNGQTRVISGLSKKDSLIDDGYRSIQAGDEVVVSQ